MDDKIMIEWIKEVNNEFKETRSHLDESLNVLKEQNLFQHAAIMAEVAKNREEFVIFKTRVNVKTATISGIIGFVVLLSSIFINIGTIKERMHDRDMLLNLKTELPKTNKT